MLEATGSYWIGLAVPLYEAGYAVAADGAWAATATLLHTIPGFGVITIAWLLVSTLNFTLCATPEQAAAYAGLVPLPHESGTSVHGRAQLDHGGNGRLHTALYLASLSSTRYNRSRGCGTG